MTLYMPDGLPLNISGLVELGSGAAGMVYAPGDTDTVCLKIYLRPTDELRRRFDGLGRVLVDWPEDPRGEARAAWPLFPLSDDTGRLRGFLLSRAHGQTLHALFDAVGRADALDAPTWATNLQVSARIADLYDRVHRVGITIGDVSPSNLIVDRSGRVTMIDCDSVQFADPSTNERFPTLNATPEYSSPEELRAAARWLNREHDLFGLAIMIWQLLTEGDHPYEGVPVKGAGNGVADNIVAGACRPFFPESLAPIESLPSTEVLPPAVFELARRTFVDGHTAPGKRPTAAHWRDALRAAEADLMGCRRNRLHFAPASLGACPWCLRADAGRGDHYPDPDGATT